MAAMDPATPPSPAPTPTLNGQSANPFDWRAFWKAADAGAVIEVAHVTFDRESDAGQLARLRSRVFKERVRFVDCRFHALVDLAMARFEKSLYLVDCTFEQGLSLRDVDVRSRLSLRGSTMRDDARFWLDWRGLRVGADMSLIGATAYAPIDLYNATIGADLRLDGLHALAKGKATEEVAKNQTLGVIDRNHVASAMVGKAITIEGAEVGRHIYADAFNGRSTTIKGQFDLRARVTGQVQFSGAIVDAGTGGKAVQMNAATIGGSVFFLDGTRITGSVDLRAKVTGQVAFESAVVDADTGGTAVNMAEAAIGGSVMFRNGTRITGTVDLRAKVAGQVAFTNAVVDACTHRTAVSMWSAEVGSSVFFVDGTHITGAVDLRARVAGGVEFVSAFVDAGTGRNAVNMDSATVGCSIFFRSGTRITGSIDLRARVTGPVEFINAVVDAGGAANAIAFESADIGGTCFLREKTLVIGSVNFLKTRLRGGLACSDIFDQTTFDRPGSNGGTTPFQCLCITGGINLEYADVSGPITIHGASVLGQIKARHLTVHGDFHICGGVVGAIDSVSREALGTFINTYRTLHTAHLQSLAAVSAADTTGMKEQEAVNLALAALKDQLNTIFSSSQDIETTATSAKGWQLWDTASTPADTKQTALDLELADIHGHVWIKGTRVLGTVRLDDAEIVGEANFEKAMIHGDLSLRSTNVSGCIQTSGLSFASADGKPAGTLDAREAHAAEIHLNMETRLPAAPPSRVLLDRADFGTLRVEGTVQDSKGNEPLYVHRTMFRDLVTDGFNADGLEPDPPVRMEHCVALAVLVGAIVLACAYAYDDDGWRWMIFVQLAVIGSGIIFWLIDDLRRSEAPPASPVLDFLACTRFSPVFYVTVERSAREAGMEPLADEVYLRRRRRELKDPPYTDAEHTVSGIRDRTTSHSAATRVWRRVVLDSLFGYGVRTVRVGTLYVLLWLLNWAVFLPAFSVERPLSFEVAAETDSAAAQGSLAERQMQARAVGTPNLWPGEGGRPGPEDHWGAQRAFFMALRLQIPLVDLFVDKPWKPADRAMFAGGEKTGGWHLTYENYAAAMRAINLILLPVVIAGAAGFLKPRDRGEHGT